MEINNPKTYVGRVSLHNEKCFGRVVPSAGCCFCLHKTMEHKRSVYEVLVSNIIETLSSFVAEERGGISLSV
jgi:hypothetical protein